MTAYPEIAMRTNVKPGMSPQMSSALENHASSMIGIRSIAREARSLQRYALCCDDAQLTNRLGPNYDLLR